MYFTQKVAKLVVKAQSETSKFANLLSPFEK